MDLQETIRQLKMERERVKSAIAALEEFLASGYSDEEVLGEPASA
jgi:hypothetical protein